MATTNTIAKKLNAGTQVVPLDKVIEKCAGELEKVLGDKALAVRAVRIAKTSMNTNPKLRECTQASFLGAVFTLAQLKLEPINGQAYLIPFNNSRKINGRWTKSLECQAIIGYRGLADFFYRHPRAVDLNWGVVREGDKFQQVLGTSPSLVHEPAGDDKAKVLGYYVVAHLVGGGTAFKYMSFDACVEHGQKHSKTWDSKAKEFYKGTPWRDNPESMHLKTVLIQLSKVLPQSVEFATAISADETSRDYSAGVTPLETPTTTNWDDAVDAEVEKTESDGTDENPKAEKKAKPKTQEAYEAGAEG